MKRAAILLLILIAELAFFTLLSGKQFDSASELFIYLKSYLADLFIQSAPILLLAFGMTIVLITAGIDLSVASIVALVACVMSSIPVSENFFWAALPAGLATGIAAGFLNGVLISRLDVPPIIATLGTMIFYRGLCYVIMGDLEKSPFLDAPGYHHLGGFTATGTIILFVFLGGGLCFTHSVWRRELLMIGGNRIAARYAAIRVERRLLQVYTAVGVLALLHRSQRFGERQRSFRA
jgi:ribose/xylose/arabinose/galactoside ABC-type transport system permease subunit